MKSITKKIHLGALALVAILVAPSVFAGIVAFTAGQVLTAAALNNNFSSVVPLAGGVTLTGPLTIPTLTVTGSLSLPSALAVANGGTGSGSASGAALDNITGFSGTGLVNRTGAGTYSFVALSSVLQASNNLSDVTNASTARTNLGLGTIATQTSSSVSLTGGTINGTAIGGSTASTGAFTTLSASSTATLNTLSSSGATITGGSINGTSIGGTTPASISATTIAGSSAVALANRTISASTSAAATDYVVLVNATSAAVTYTLPAASSSTNRILVIQKIDSSGNAVTVAPNGADTINGSASQVISAQFGAVTVQSNGTAWTILQTTISTLG